MEAKSSEARSTPAATGSAHRSLLRPPALASTPRLRSSTPPASGGAAATAGGENNNDDAGRRRGRKQTVWQRVGSATLTGVAHSVNYTNKFLPGWAWLVLALGLAEVTGIAVFGYLASLLDGTDPAGTLGLFVVALAFVAAVARFHMHVMSHLPEDPVAQIKRLHFGSPTAASQPGTTPPVQRHLAHAQQSMQHLMKQGSTLISHEIEKVGFTSQFLTWRYQSRLLAVIVFFFCSMYCNALASTISGWRTPNIQTLDSITGQLTPAKTLPDLGHDLFDFLFGAAEERMPAQMHAAGHAASSYSWAARQQRPRAVTIGPEEMFWLKLPDLLVALTQTPVLFMVFAHPKRLLILKRILAIYGPSKFCGTPDHNESTAASHSYTTRAWILTVAQLLRDPTTRFRQWLPGRVRGGDLPSRREPDVHVAVWQRANRCLQSDARVPQGFFTRAAGAAAPVRTHHVRGHGVQRPHRVLCARLARVQGIPYGAAVRHAVHAHRVHVDPAVPHRRSVGGVHALHGWHRGHRRNPPALHARRRDRHLHHVADLGFVPRTVRPTEQEVRVTHHPVAGSPYGIPQNDSCGAYHF